MSVLRELFYVAIVIAVCIAIWYGPPWFGWVVFGVALACIFYTMYTTIKNYISIAESVAESILERMGCCAQCSPKNPPTINQDISENT